MDSGKIAFWVLTASAIIAWLSVILKLTWWKATVGLWFFVITGVFVFEMAFIVTLQLDRWPEYIKDNARAIIYGSLAFVLWLLIIDIWRQNWHRWAWSKDD